MMNALGGGSKRGSETAQSPETLSEGSAVLIGASAKGNASTAGERAGEPSHHHGPHAHLHDSNVPLRSSETKRVYVPLIDEVIRDVKRHRHHPKILYPGYPGYPNYPPYYPYPYPYPYDAEYSDVSDDEHRHHHHHRPHSRHRYESEREHEHDHHHGRHHPHHAPFYPPPPWFDSFHPGPVHPHNQAYNPAPPTHHRIPFSGPLYASIPALSNTFDQNRSAFYSLPVPPTTLLRDLQEARAMQVPAEPAPAARAAPNPADRQEFLKGFEYLCSETDMLKGLPVLAYQECQAFYIDAVYRRLSDLVQVRFAERRGDDIINRVHLVQRNRLAFGTVMQYRPKLDVDLVLPGDYMLRRWVVDANASADEKPRTIAKAFKLDAASVHRGEIDAKDLGWTIKAVLAQLNGSVDQYIFPGGTGEAGKYLGSFDSSATAEGTNRIRLMTVDPSPVRVNVFIKVAIEVGGQEMVVGVDQASAVSAGKYQMVKLIRQPNGPLGESPVSSIERSALIALGWWKRGVVQGDVPSKTPPGKPKLRASHFGIALKALHALDPSDELYVPHSKLKTQVFGFALVADVMWKIASYLKRSYESPILIAAANGPTTAGPNGLAATAEYMFPLSSCGTMEALYTQAASNAGEIDTLKGSGVLDDLIAFLQPRRPTSGAATSTTPAAAASATPAATASTTTANAGGSTSPSALSGLTSNAKVTLGPQGVTVAGDATKGSTSLAGGVMLGQQGVQAADLKAATEQGAVAGAVSAPPGGPTTVNVDVKSNVPSGSNEGAPVAAGGVQPAATGSG
ncbi:hypothetical protein FRC09_003733 [Ceratobasidium sp. 395]|nr:hypothetical protein FRC09_003733 [Ceratobasidium sp. 395]